MIIFILVFLFRITYNNSYETSLAMIIIIGLIDVITTFFFTSDMAICSSGELH